MTTEPDLSRVELDTLRALRQLGEVTRNDLAAHLGVQTRTMTRRLWRLRQLGWAAHNGKRGDWSRWRAATPTDHAELEVSQLDAIAVAVHKELCASPGWTNASQLAARLEIREAMVKAACVRLVQANVLQELGDHVRTKPPARADPEDLGEVIDSWVDGLSELARRHLSANDRLALLGNLKTWAAQ